MPPTKNISRLNVKYKVPMSLWFVVVIHRVSHARPPCGEW